MQLETVADDDRLFEFPLGEIKALGWFGTVCLAIIVVTYAPPVQCTHAPAHQRCQSRTYGGCSQDPKSGAAMALATVALLNAISVICLYNYSHSGYSPELPSQAYLCLLCLYHM